MDSEARFKRLHFRAWHRGTREADFMMGGFFGRYRSGWGKEEADWFEALLDEEDVDIMAWALGVEPVPERFQGELMAAMQKLDYVDIPR